LIRRVNGSEERRKKANEPTISAYHPPGYPPTAKSVETVSGLFDISSLSPLFLYCP